MADLPKFDVDEYQPPAVAVPRGVPRGPSFNPEMLHPSTFSKHRPNEPVEPFNCYTFIRRECCSFWHIFGLVFTILIGALCIFLASLANGDDACDSSTPPAECACDASSDLGEDAKIWATLFIVAAAMYVFAFIWWFVTAMMRCNDFYGCCGRCCGYNMPMIWWCFAGFTQILGTVWLTLTDCVRKGHNDTAEKAGYIMIVGAVVLLFLAIRYICRSPEHDEEEEDPVEAQPKAADLPDLRSMKEKKRDIEDKHGGHEENQPLRAQDVAVQIADEAGMHSGQPSAQPSAQPSRQPTQQQM